MFDTVRVATSEGGGAGGDDGFEDCVWISSRAIVEDEMKRLGMSLAIFVLRTHRRHVLNCRIDGTAVDMAPDRVVMVPHLVVEVWENVHMVCAFHPNLRDQLRNICTTTSWHGFHEDICTHAWGRQSIGQTVYTT